MLLRVNFVEEGSVLRLKKRHNDIVDAVNQHGRLSVEKLARRFGVSAETIRRDLSALSESGRLQKVHGGAKRARLSTEASFQARMSEEAEAKLHIAEKLADTIEPDDTLFIDTGSTTLACARALAQKGAFTVITNSVHIAETFDRARNGASVHLIGGRFSTDNAQTLGPMAIEHIGGFQTDHAVLTVFGNQCRDRCDGCKLRRSTDRPCHAAPRSQHHHRGRSVKGGPQSGVQRMPPG